MARIPRFLLRHTVSVQPATSTWGTYGAATTVRCFFSDRLATSRGQAGVERVALPTLFADPDDFATLREGGKVTLPDGRVGYIQASVLHDSNQLGTPDHVQAAVAVGSAYGPAFGETVVLLRRTITGQDRYGSDLYTTVEVPVPGCAVRPLASQEDLGDYRDQITTSVEVIMPPGTVVTAVDRLRIRGLVYEIDGVPTEQVSSVTGARPGVRVIARRVTG